MLSIQPPQKDIDYKGSSGLISFTLENVSTPFYQDSLHKYTHIVGMSTLYQNNEKYDLQYLDAA